MSTFKNSFSPSLLGGNPFGQKRNVLRKMLKTVRPKKASISKAKVSGRASKSGGNRNVKSLTNSISGGLKRFGSGAGSTVGPASTGGLGSSANLGSPAGDQITGGGGANLGMTKVF